jgi:hypothetical protein
LYLSKIRQQDLSLSVLDELTVTVTVNSKVKFTTHMNISAGAVMAVPAKFPGETLHGVVDSNSCFLGFRVKYALPVAKNAVRLLKKNTRANFGGDSSDFKIAEDKNHRKKQELFNPTTMMMMTKKKDLPSAVRRRAASTTKAVQLLLIATLAGLTIPTTTFACSVIPSSPLGPFMVDPYPDQDSHVISTTDPNLLIGTVQNYTGDINAPSTPPINVTIVLSTALVTKSGLPSSVTATVPPTALTDPTGGGYAFSVAGSQATIESPDGFSVLVVVNLTAPDNFALSQDVQPGYNNIFFVSDKLQYGYVLYETVANCAAGSKYDKCTSECSTCNYTQGSAALVNLKDQTYTIVPFEYNDFYIFPNTNNMVNYNTLSTVYDEIQIAQLGPEDSCGGKTYFFYNETSVAPASFIEGYLKSLHYGATPALNTAYELKQDEVFTEGNATDGSDYGTRYVTAFKVVERYIVTGDIVRTVPLSYDSVVAAVDGTGGGGTGQGPGTSNTSTTAPIPVAVPTPPSGMPLVGTSTRPSTTVPGAPAPPTSAPLPTAVSGTAAPVEATGGGGGGTGASSRNTSQPVSPESSTTTTAPASASSSSYAPSDMPSNVQSDVPSTLPLIDARDCQAVPSCALLGLGGQCCPTGDNWTLACCGTVTVEETCALNNKCNSLGLTGACCPTIDSKYLDCCAVLPDDCKRTGNCTVYSAQQYKLDLATQAAAKSSARPLSDSFFLLSLTFSVLIAYIV